MSAAAIAGGMAAGQAISGVIDTGVNTWQRYEDRKFNSAEAQKQRDWEEYMSNSAYQRSVADMKKAGLNPAMMYGGSGAASSTPTNSAASINSSKVSDFSSFVNSAANLVSAFNSDKNTSNDLTPSSSAKLIDTYAKIFE